MELVDRILEKLREWVDRIVDRVAEALEGGSVQPQPEPIPVPVRDRMPRR
ncbi:hypothetical protein [Synechococcus sp. PCC 7336]|nr:hypothetical protein [Synechococcus sp. PCC 7336]